MIGRNQIAIIIAHEFSSSAGNASCMRASYRQHSGLNAPNHYCEYNRIDDIDDCKGTALIVHYDACLLSHVAHIINMISLILLITSLSANINICTFGLLDAESTYSARNKMALNTVRT